MSKFQSRFLNCNSFRRGDTMVEVLISLAIFVFVAMISMNTMSRGVAQSQSTLEITMSRNAMDMQAETVRFWHEAASGASANYVNSWANLINSGNTLSQAQYNSIMRRYKAEFTDGGCPINGTTNLRLRETPAVPPQ